MALLDSLRNRPNFFIIGAAKSGTTRLHHLLGQHPEVFVPGFKEPGFFDRDPPLPGRLELYLELFRDVGGAKAVGEASTAYSRSKRWPGTAKRIFQFNPHAKLIYVVRHPLRRIESFWVQSRENHPETPRDFCEMVRSEILDTIDGTLYWKQLSEYRAHFPDKQILLLFFEEFIRDEAGTLRRCFEFLCVDPNVLVDCSGQERRNSFVGKRGASALLDFLRGSHLYRRLRRFVPMAVKNKLRPAFLRPIGLKPTWDEATWRWAVQQLQSDTAKLLAHAGKPTDFWGWDCQFAPGQTNSPM